ncbi:MAG: hypothetical protein CSA04_01975, partial [Bacteroidetes bacterium]
MGQDHCVKGTVYDASTQEPIPFVNVVVSNSRAGVMTDIDGAFTLCAARVDSL